MSKRRDIDDIDERALIAHGLSGLWAEQRGLGIGVAIFRADVEHIMAQNADFPAD